MEQKSKKTSTLTFRLDEKFEKALRKEAENKRISLNTLANQIFGDHVEFQKFLKKFGIISMSKGGFKVLLDTISEKELITVAKEIGSKEPKDFILFKWKEINSDSVSEFIKMYFEHCGYGICDIYSDEGRKQISIHHDFGKKGSVFLEHFLHALIQSSLDRDCKIVKTDNSVNLSL